MVLSFDAKRLQVFMKKADPEIVKLRDSYCSLKIAVCEFDSAFWALNLLMKEYGLNSTSNEERPPSFDRGDDEN